MEKPRHLRSSRPLRTSLGIWAGLLLASAAGAQTLLEDVTEASGLRFEHWNGRTGALYFPEMTGQGAALFDYDNDGDLDAYLVQGTYLRTADRGKTLEKAPPDARLRDRLFRNDGVKDGVPRFVDVTEASGLVADGYGMGVATGDVDGDGFVDLYLANFGPNQLWRNRGDGTFENHTAAAGLAGAPEDWTIGASMADFDRDGALDLVVIDYVRYDVEKNPRCFASSSRLDYCGPSSFPPTPNHFFRNRGDGTFEDLSTRSGLAAAPGASLGVVAEDLDGDGLLDIYVANDGKPNHLWIQQKDGTFRDDALLAGVALNREGRPEASMGVTLGDTDGDGDSDLFMTHLMGETNTLYVNQGGAFFEDRTIETGLAGGSLAFTSFGTGFVDVDADSLLDLVILSGSVKILEDQVRAGVAYPLGQKNQLFLNRGGTFVEASARGGDAFERLEVSRGLALGDVDDDGDVDLLVTNNHGPARLLRVKGSPDRWIGVDPRIKGKTAKGSANRVALGAKVEFRLDGKGPPNAVWRRVATDGSYASAGDPRAVTALPAGRSVTETRIHWPDGKVESFSGLELGSYHRLIQGNGKAVSPGPAGDRP